jgi:hypothetical protein
MPFDFSEMIESNVGRFTVGFARIDRASATSMGSGTLMTFGTFGGILTCAHVLEELAQLDEFGIVSFPVRPDQFQILRIRISDTSHVKIGAPPWTKYGPDIGFLRLPAVTMSNLSSVASVVDASGQRAAAVTGVEPDPRHCVDIVSGVIDEWTGNTNIRGTIATTPFELLLNVGKVISKTKANGHDLFRFEPVPAPTFNLPTSYKGTSGGGLWRLYTKRHDDGSFSLVQRRLVGVAFWETAEEHHLICHGRSSLYDHLFASVRRQWPNH